jgi:autotransporter-associated beta strand protein
MKTQFESKARNSFLRLWPLRAACITLAFAITAHAADITTETQMSAFPVASDDLLQTALASTSDGLGYNGSYNPSGKSYADLIDSDSAGEPVIENGTLTFTLDTTSNTLGYDLTSIQTFTTHPDGGRDGQDYSVSYSTVSAPATFLPLADVNYLTGDNGTPGSGKVSLTNLGASNVVAIRFTFDTQENYGSTWAEIDVVGSPSSAIADQDGTWNSNTDGNWTDTSNWLAAAPASGAGRTASFTAATGVNVALDAGRTIGNLVFNNADYVLNGPAVLSLAPTSGSPTITVGDAGGTRLATIAADLGGSSGLAKTGNGILILSGNQGYTGGTTVNGGTLVLQRPIASGAVTIQSGTLEIIETLGGGGADYNWYMGVPSTTVQTGGVLSINSHSGLINLTLSGGELASSGVDPVNGYGSWSLQGDSCTATGGVTSIISAQQVDFNSLTNGFVVETGSTLEITGSLKNGTLTKNGPGLMILAAPRTGTDNTFVNEGALQVSDAGGSLRFRPTSAGSSNSITGDSDASLAFNGTMDLDLSAASLVDGNTWLLIDGGSFSAPGSLTFGANFTVTSNSVGFTEVSPGVWELPVTGAKWTFTEADGLLEYTVTATDYDTWASSFSLTGGTTGDDDNDGYSNQDEYAFGLIPNSGSSANPIPVPLNKNTGIFAYTRRDPSLPNPPLDYSFWYSTDLVTWSEDIGATPGTPVLDGEVETVPVTISPSLLANPKLFIQVRAN